MRGFTDWQSLGIFPLQDHDPQVSSGVRQQLVGGRISLMMDATQAGSGNDLMIELAVDADGKAVIGDLHPWRFWQTAARSKRASGSWSQAFATMVVGERSPGGGPTTPRGGDTGQMLEPIGGPWWESDERYEQVVPFVPYALSQPVRGSAVLAMATTDETQQLNLAFTGIDARLWAPHVSGPSSCGTVVCDLQPEREACMDGATRPGQGGRQALLQGAWRVIAQSPASSALIPGTNYNGLAWNLTLAEKPGVAGFGMVWAKLDATGGQGPTTGGGGGGPITHGLGLGGETDLPGEHVGNRVSEWGKFSPRREPANGVAFLAQLGASGPIHAGHQDDKHRVGVDRDGHAMNSGHLSVNAYWYRGRDHDGPMLFEGLYPNPGPLPLITRVHLTWDAGLNHPFVGGMRGGMWRWYAEAPMLVPTGTPGEPPTTPPRDPRRPTGPGPAGPTTPAPGAPGPGRGTPTPTGPGRGGPATPTPIPGGSGPRPAGPITPPAIPPKPPRGGGWRGPTTGGAPLPGSGPGGSAGERAGNGGEPDTRDPTEPRPADNPEPWPEGAPWPEWPDPQPGAPGSVDYVGETQGDDHAAWLLHFPHMQGQTGMAWRPQLWRCGDPSYLHSPNWGVEDMRASELRQPQVLAMHAFGAQEQDGFDYVAWPQDARARGGTANGGVLLVPPEWEPEDVLGICGHDQVSAAAAQTGYFGLATGVRLAFGLPTLTGDVGPLGWDLTQQWDSTRTLLLRQQTSGGTWTSVASAYLSSNQPVFRVHGTAAIRIPVGDNADRPALGSGELRINDETTVSLVEHNQDGAWATVASIQAPAAGDLLYFDGTEWQRIDASGASAGDVLTWNGTVPEWAPP